MVLGPKQKTKWKKETNFPHCIGDTYPKNFLCGIIETGQLLFNCKHGNRINPKRDFDGIINR